MHDPPPSCDRDRPATRMEIDLDAVAANYREVARLAGAREIVAVVKGDAYGHGAIAAARALSEAGARLLAAGSMDEAIVIRRTGPHARGAMDPLVIVDDQHYLHRFHVERPRAALGILQPQAAQPLIHRLREIWATGEPGVHGAVLGL